MDQEEQRFIANPFPQYAQGSFNLEAARQNSLILLLNNIIEFYSAIKPGETRAIASTPRKNYPDYSNFDGAGSYLIVYVKLFKFFKSIQQNDLAFLKKVVPPEQHSLLDSATYERDINTQINNLANLINTLPNKRPDVAFFFSPVGVYLTEMIYFAEIGDLKACQILMSKIIQYEELVVENQNKMYFEILYGTTGYLYCLLFAQKHFSNMLTPELKEKLSTAITSVYQITLSNGISLQEKDPQFRLVYTFHKREYLGGAHGLFGICNILMSCLAQNPSLKAIKTVNCQSMIQKSIRFCASLQLDSGNFPSGLHKKETDVAVQFCHGSPGAVSPLLLASKLFQDPKFENQSLKAGENIWQNGILLKGFGICHGISGNAYAFLSLFRTTKDQKWLYYAHSFAALKQNESVMKEIKSYDFSDRYLVGQSDYPYSYMLGIAGDICFIADTIYPDTSLFLGYEI